MITIVIPVYNTGMYLKECIESVLKQTYENFELICVDDGSEDVLTQKLLGAYAIKDERIRIIRLLKKVGAAEARNIGLKQARGEYIIFLDADDWFDADMIEKMHDSLVSSDADMSVCGYRIWSEQTKAVINKVSLKNILGITDRVFCVSELGDEGLLLLSTFPWNKMCKKEFLQKNKIYFQALSSSNDVFYSLMCGLSAKSIVYCESGRPFITYRVGRSNQISAHRAPKNLLIAIQLLISTRLSCMSQIEWNQITAILVTNGVWELKCSTNEIKKKVFYEEIKFFIKEHKDKLNVIDRRIKCYISLFEEYAYGTKWFEKAGDFESQIKEHEDVIKTDVFSIKGMIVIWGNGKRGQAFQHYCKKKGIINICVTDQKNHAVGNYTREGFKIIHTNKVFEEASVIVASNHMIYMDLYERLEDVSGRLIDLERFCPID